jgi:peptide chain release factor 2
MLQFEELKKTLEEQMVALDSLRDSLGLERLREEVEMLELKAAAPGFWDDMETAQKVTQRTANLKAKDEKYLNLESKCEDTLTMIEMGDEEEDLSLVPEIEADIEDITTKIEAMRLETLLTGEYDKNNAILTFHAGSGGTEAQDWAEMLFRMYNRWGERHGFKVSTLDYLDGDEAGLKSASILVEGENAYGFLKSEAGVHRLVRVSPFDAAGRRHTSFSSLEVMPEIEEDLSVEIPPEDIKMEVYRASGAGGQKVNKTSSAVRLIHIPTGIVVASQVERSQYQNRDVAMKMLISKLVEIKEKEHLDKLSDIKGVQKEITWGSQIRSYVFMPYTLVKDHRTKHETGNINAVMDGDLDPFITAYLTALSQGTLDNSGSDD